jgi:uncharacterized protein (DUF302 family)
MKKAIAMAAVGLSLSATVVAEQAKVDGFISVESAHSVKDTADKLETVLNSKGMTVFNRINHQQGAEKAGLQLRETEVILFGNPKVGTPLMQCAQSVAIDLPQKALIWKDEAGKVWLSYNDPAYLAARHNIEGCEAALKKVSGALAKFAMAASE